MDSYTPIKKLQLKKRAKLTDPKRVKYIHDEYRRKASNGPKDPTYGQGYYKDG